MDNALNHRNQWALAKYMSTFEIPETMPSMLYFTEYNGKIYFILCAQKCFNKSQMLSMI